jgi:HJR/Mrr/RecB family endonuclease
MARHRTTFLTLSIDLVFFVVMLPIRIVRSALHRHRNYTLHDIDKMTGMEFEKWVALKLKNHGFTHVHVTEQYDYGVDILAIKDGVRWGVQVKRHSSLVKAEAVRQVVTALNHYKCDKAMVITNSYFSEVAKKLAKSNDCILVDRNRLSRYV